MQEKILQHINQFEPISLKEMDAVKLLNRNDTKFIFNVSMLPALLEEVRPHYRVLEINQVRMASYKTLYYDTPDLRLFQLHQNGRTHRFKVRFRNYVDSLLTFLEVKKKNNKGRTIKTRIKISEIEKALSPESATFLKKELQLDDVTQLQPVLKNNFYRITLVNKNCPERVTIDTGVTFSFNGERREMNELAIAEVKRDKLSSVSAFAQAMRNAHIIPRGISKYCLGTILLKPYIKHNTFKVQLRVIEKIINHALLPAA